jgi:hypothetical protein
MAHARAGTFAHRAMSLREGNASGDEGGRNHCGFSETSVIFHIKAPKV